MHTCAKSGILTQLMYNVWEPPLVVVVVVVIVFIFRFSYISVKRLLVVRWRERQNTTTIRKRNTCLFKGVAGVVEQQQDEGKGVDAHITTCINRKRANSYMLYLALFTIFLLRSSIQSSSAAAGAANQPSIYPFFFLSIFLWCLVGGAGCCCCCFCCFYCWLPFSQYTKVACNFLLCGGRLYVPFECWHS